MRTVGYCLICTLLWGWNSASASADVIVTFRGSNIYGAGGTIDMLISSNADPGTPDVLDIFSAKLRIAPVAGLGTGGNLRFSSPQNDSQLSQPNYVFFSNTLTPPPLGTVTTETFTDDTYTFGDATQSGSGVILDRSRSPLLLARLDVVPFGTDETGQYVLSLINDGDTMFVGPDPDFLPLNVVASSFNNFTVNYALVPEPGTLGASVAVIAGITAWRRRRRTTACSQSPSVSVS